MSAVQDRSFRTSRPDTIYLPRLYFYYGDLEDLNNQIKNYISREYFSDVYCYNLCITEDTIKVYNIEWPAEIKTMDTATSYVEDTLQVSFTEEECAIAKYFLSSTLLDLEELALSDSTHYTTLWNVVKKLDEAEAIFKK